MYHRVELIVEAPTQKKSHLNKSCFFFAVISDQLQSNPKGPSLQKFGHKVLFQSQQLPGLYFYFTFQLFVFSLVFFLLYKPTGKLKIVVQKVAEEL